VHRPWPDPSRWVVPFITFLSFAWLSAGHANDFMVYRAAGRALLDGGWSAVYEIGSLTPFKYHPVFAIAFVPFALLPAAAAKIAWAALNAATIYDAARRWQRHWGLDAAAIGLGFVAVAYALTWQFKFANVTFVMLWLWTCALTCTRAWVAALACAVLVALKPFWAALLVPWLLSRRFALTARVLGTLLALSLVPAVLGPRALESAYGRWFATFADPLHAHNYPKADNQSWFGLLYRHLDALPLPLPALWLAGCSVLGLFWLWNWRGALTRGLDTVPAWQVETSFLPVILFAAPLSWIHHQVLLWPLLALVWQAGRSDRVSRGVYGGAFGLLTLTGQGLMARQAMRAVLRAGTPLLAMPLLVWWSGRQWDTARRT
jgi:alpha-1,2-mannosyltransferase